MAFDPFTEGFSLVKTALDKWLPDADTELKGKLESAAAEIANVHAEIIGQITINQEEAKHPSKLVAGWRPALGWVGAASLAYNFLLMPIINGILVTLGLPAAFVPTPTQEVVSLIMGLTGLGAARSYDKSKGVDTKKVV